MDRATLVASRNAPLGCARGCSWCCHVDVEATPAEVEHIARFVARAFDPDALEALLNRLRARGPRTSEERWAARVPCALLDAEGACSVYEARPLRCRAFHSLDADACREAYAGRRDEVPPADRGIGRAAERIDDAVGGPRVLLEPALLAALKG